MYLQDMIFSLQKYWADKGCNILQPYDVEMGAATFHPITFFRSLSRKNFSAAFVQPCRRPKDGRYGQNPNRYQHYYQFQVLMKPSPENIQELYLGSLEAIGVELKKHDIRFVEDDWESPTLGAWGLGWEVWLDGMEVTQFTYFQQIGGLDIFPMNVELAYGIERLAMYIQNVDSIKDLKWNENTSYGEIFFDKEVEFSAYNFDELPTESLFKAFDDYEAQARSLIKKELPYPAYDAIIKSSHAFNLLDANGVISVLQRASYINRIRRLAKECALAYIDKYEKET